MKDEKYFVLRKKAVPEVLLKVLEAKKLMETGKASSVSEATDIVGISRGSFYKYKDDIFPFYDNQMGTTVTMLIQLDDKPGLLSLILKIIATYNANIITINQSIPSNDIALLTISIDLSDNTENLSELIEEIENQEGIYKLNILSRE